MVNIYMLWLKGNRWFGETNLDYHFDQNEQVIVLILKEKNSYIKGTF